MVDMIKIKRLHRKERKRQRKIIIFSMCLVFLGFSTGYAAFSTGIVMNAKGNIKEKAISVSELKTEVVTSGDGLYKDYTEDGRYVYKGVNPNNYIKLGDDMYRIIAAESDNTLKVVRSKSIGAYVIDNMHSRQSQSSDDFCYNDYGKTYYGCNVWGNKYTMLDSYENNITQMARRNDKKNLPEKEATLNTFLNNEWISTLSSDVAQLIVSHIFNVGYVSMTEYTDLKKSTDTEKQYKWKGKIGLINVTDYVKVGLDSELCGSVYLNSSNSSNATTCQKANWMYLSFGMPDFWTITPVSNGYPTNWVHLNPNSGFNGFYDVSTVGGGGDRNVVPAFFLSSNILLKGHGTESQPYIVAQ